MAAINVTAARNLIDQDTGNVMVSKGASGTVQEYFGVPPDSPLVYSVEFSTSGGPVLYNCIQDDLIFEDGKLGPARVVFEGVADTVTRLRYTGAAADYEQQLGTQPIASSGSIDIEFGVGPTLRISSNRNTGELVVELV